ncbi:hypothetical protein CV093_10875 [Oceanobacillus sp. 143]|nr:hypothetical protein CV093_10875 [Oceanobacillus sp. 143]
MDTKEIIYQDEIVDHHEAPVNDEIELEISILKAKECLLNNKVSCEFLLFGGGDNESDGN